MKKTFFFLCIVSLLFTACKPDVEPCTAVCVNGACVNNACDCELGYEGVDCSVAINSKLSGTYAAFQSCDACPVGPFTLDLSPKSGTTMEFTFVGLWEVPLNPVTAVIGSSGLDFTIARQPIESIFEIESTNGTITADGDSLSLTFRIYKTGESTMYDRCYITLNQ